MTNAEQGIANVERQRRDLLVSELDERTIKGLKVQIDKTLCCGFADCSGEAPEAFQVDDDEVVYFVKPEEVERERLIRACDLCPVDALTVWDETGKQIVP